MKYTIMLILLLSGCKVAKPACQVIDLVDEACHTFILLDDNGKKQEVKMTSAEAREYMSTGRKIKAGTCK